MAGIGGSDRNLRCRSNAQRFSDRPALDRPLIEHMGHHHRRPSAFFPLLLAATPVLAPLACSTTNTPSAGPGEGLPAAIFGGSAGIEQPVLAGASALGSAGMSVTTPTDVCRTVPQGTVALIDDFEDGDSVAVPEVDREAYWFTVHDDSAGMIDPDTNFLPVAPGAHGSAFAAHIKASGYSVWGAGFSANISHFAGGIRCPYNASKFSGLRFYARGSSRVRVELFIPEVVDELYGGKCDPSAGQVCYDTHGVWVALTPDWKLYSFPWSQFVQRNFGVVAAFRPDAIMTLQLAFEQDQLPADVWFDDVSWEDGSAPPSSGADGGGGTSGVEAGVGGESSEGGASGAQPGAGGASGESAGGVSASAGQGGT
jgi:hypothetical protein